MWTLSTGTVVVLSPRRPETVGARRNIPGTLSTGTVEKDSVGFRPTRLMIDQRLAKSGKFETAKRLSRPKRGTGPNAAAHVIGHVTIARLTRRHVRPSSRPSPFLCSHLSLGISPRLTKQHQRVHCSSYLRNTVKFIVWIPLVCPENIIGVIAFF